MARPMVVRVGDLLRDLGSGRDLDRSVDIDPIATSAASTIPGMPLLLAGTATSMLGSVEVIGTVTYDWYGPCRRCLDDVDGRNVVDFREICQRKPVDDEMIPIEGDLLDLEPLVRELVLASLPLAPICRAECPGPDPERFPTVAEDDIDPTVPTAPATDPRWAALSDLEFGDA